MTYLGHKCQLIEMGENKMRGEKKKKQSLPQQQQRQQNPTYYK